MSRELLTTHIQTFLASSLATIEETHMAAHFLEFLDQNPACFERTNKGHVTSSIWIINHDRTHALLTHHKKFNLWIQLGGHNDGMVDCKEVALKEAYEESGIAGLRFLHEGIFDIDIHRIANACWHHYDVRYLLQAPPENNFTVSDESLDLAWVPFDKIPEYTLHSSVLRMNEKCKQLLKNL